MEPDDEEPLEPYRSPDDRERIWLHPSELGSLLPPVPEAGRLRRRRRPPWRRFRALTVPVLSGMIGAALSLGILALAGGLDRAPSDRVVETAGEDEDAEGEGGADHPRKDGDGQGPATAGAAAAP